MARDTQCLTSENCNVGMWLVGVLTSHLGRASTTSDFPALPVFKDHLRSPAEVNSLKLTDCARITNKPSCFQSSDLRDLSLHESDGKRHAYTGNKGSKTRAGYERKIPTNHWVKNIIHTTKAAGKSSTTQLTKHRNVFHPIYPKYEA